MRFLLAMTAVLLCASVEAPALNDEARLVLKNPPLSVELRCPSGANGILEHTKVSRQDGRRIRWRYTYRNNDIITLWMGESRNDGAFMEKAYYDRRTETDPLELETIAIMVEQSNWFLREVCLGSREAREKFFTKLKANKEELGIK